MNEFRMHRKLMGSAFELSVYHFNRDKAIELLEKGVIEIERIESLLSTFIDSSITCQINRNAGISPVTVTDEFFNLVERCRHISTLTSGAFDITAAPLKNLYNFKNSNFKIPDQPLINSTLENTGYHLLELNPEKSEIYLLRKNMSISFAAIGKGYAADCVKKLWIHEGVESGAINASGDLCTIGTKPGGTPWNVGIADPFEKGKILYYIPFADSAVATSGNSEQFFIDNGVKYSHNINPVSGKPVTGISSVTVFSHVAELSDALATAVYVMGKEAGIDCINQLPGTHCLIIDEHKNTFFSKGLEFSDED